MRASEIIVFSEEWFIYHQRILLYLLNHRLLGRAIRETLEINCELPIVKYLPNCYHFFDGEKFHAVFYTRNLLARTLHQRWFYLWMMFHKWDAAINKLGLEKLNLGFDTLTSYPDANPETYTVDGQVRGTASSWAAVISASSGDNVQSSIEAGLICSARKASDTLYYNWRGFYLFSTSSLPSGVNISTAKLSFAGTGYTTIADDSGSIEIVSANPASNTDLVASDYSCVGNTSFSSLTFDSFGYTNNVYNDFVLNSSGINNITTSVSKFAGRWSGDLNGTAPTGNNQMRCYNADTSNNKPKLTVTYTLPANLIPTNVQNIMTQIRM